MYAKIVGFVQKIHTAVSVIHLIYWRKWQ